jgi:hypothetical protein
VVDARPLHAYVAKSNVASLRVLEKCGFVKVDEHAGGHGTEELLLELRAWDDVCGTSRRTPSRSMLTNVLTETGVPRSAWIRGEGGRKRWPADGLHPG